METKKVSLWEIFAVFAKIGAFTIGGGYMMVPAIQAEMSRRGWISDEELPDIVALAQSAPGLLTVNMSIFAGYRMRGVKGSIAATLGCITPPFLVILAIAMFFSSFKDNEIISRIFCGVRPVAVAVILAYAVKLCRKQARWWQLGITFITLLAVAFLKISPIYIMIASIVIGAAVAKAKEERR